MGIPVNTAKFYKLYKILANYLFPSLLFWFLWSYLSDRYTAFAIAVTATFVALSTPQPPKAALTFRKASHFGAAAVRYE